MSINLTWTITAIIAISSFLSPVAVAVINNRHNAKLKKLELEHIETMKQIDLQQQTAVRQFDIYYADKKIAFSEFLASAGSYSMHKGSSASYGNFQTSLHKALLFCSTDTKDKLMEFLSFADKIFGGSYAPSERDSYSKALTAVTITLNQELESTKPVINSK